MAFSIQQKINQAMAPTQRKIFDMNVQSLGVETQAILLKITVDKYDDATLDEIDNKVVFCYINFPGQEVPMPQDSDTNTTADNTLHMYDILPITAYFKFSDDIKKGYVFLHKIKIDEGVYQVTPYQVLEPIGRATVTDIVFIEYHVAPLTNYEINNNVVYQQIIADFTSEDNWDLSE